MYIYRIIIYMKASIFGILLFACSHCSAQQQKFEGIWEGKINAGVDLRLVFEFRSSAPGYLTAMLTSPDQTPTPVKMDSAWIKGDSVFVIAPKYRISLVASAKMILISMASLYKVNPLPFT